MTLKEMFKKVETYNEIAEMMQTEKAQIYFYINLGPCNSGEHFSNFKDLRRYIKKEFVSECAEKLLAADNWELDGEIEIDSCGTVDRFGAQLTAA